MKKKVLIIDDDESIAAMIRFLLQGEGYDVGVANRGEEGLEKVSSWSPDLIILDVNMPGLDGFTVCELIKRRADTKDIPVIFLTVKDRMGDFEQGFSVGAVEYLMKPVDSDKLLRAVRSHLP